ncbi:hypothetical protein C8Q76DRAFT_404560 [Earliella scabrosa]|nr:hypothetical protein C8Q76DRAFT_404560 [Earliella scabrosa]
MEDILEANAWLVGLWLQLFVAGAYICYIPRCVFVLRTKLREGVSFWLPGVCVVIFVIILTVLISDITFAYKAYSVRNDGEASNKFALYADITSISTYIKGVGQVSMALISDFVMVYRTFVVWELNLVVIAVPVLLLLTDMALGFLAAWTLFHPRTTESVQIEADVNARVRYFFILTFAVNSICAALICYKIRSVHSLVGKRDGVVSRVFEVIIQTASLYCVHLFILIVAQSVGSNVYFIFLDPLQPVTALVFTMLIVRTRMPNRSSSASTWSTSICFRSMTRTGDRTTTGPGRPVTLIQTRVVDMDLECAEGVSATTDTPEAHHSDEPQCDLQMEKRTRSSVQTVIIAQHHNVTVESFAPLACP